MQTYFIDYLQNGTDLFVDGLTAKNNNPIHSLL